MSRSRILPLTLLLALVAALAPLATGPAAARDSLPAPVGQDKIIAGAAYAGDFPDPWILRVGQRYVAYSTTSDNLNLPTLISADLRTWQARPETPDAPRGDALPVLPPWAGSQGPWAPSVTKVAKKRFVLAYSVEYGEGTRRMCVSVATSTSSTGPFVDTGTGPLVCPRRGAIDPQIYVPPTGRPWLVWKADHFPAKLFTAPMNRAATRLLPGRRKHFLAKVAQPWEGSIIENPSMIRYKKRYYLFYSANSYASTRYAIGYLICKSWKGDCKRPRKRPLIASIGAVAGPGGQAPFVDTRGKLRLGYHAWNAGTVGYASSGDPCVAVGSCGQRRLYVAKLGVKRNGRLKVRQYY